MPHNMIKRVIPALIYGGTAVWIAYVIKPTIEVKYNNWEWRYPKKSITDTEFKVKEVREDNKIDK